MRVRASGFIAVLTVMAALLPLPAGAIMPTMHWVPLPDNGFGDVVLNQSTGHVYVTSGGTYSTIRVFGYYPLSVKTITGQPGAMGMVLSADESRLYVALGEASAVSVIDTTSLEEVGRWALPGYSPGTLALAAGRLWIGASSASSSSAVLSIDPTDPAAEPRIDVAGLAGNPLIAAGANRIAVLESGSSPASLKVLDVTGGTVQSVVDRSDTGASNGQDIAVTPDGSSVVLAAASPSSVQVFSTADLSTTASYPSGASPRAVALSGDGSTIFTGTNAASPALWVWDWLATAPHTKAYPDAVYRGGLAANPTGTVYAAVTGGNGSRFVLNVLKRDWGTNMSLSAQASQLLLGDGVHVSGVLSAGDSTFPGQELTVQRTLSGGAPVTLPSMTTDEFGAFAFDDVPDTAGSYSYQVHYAPDVEHQQITKAVEVTVNKHPVALTPWAVKPSRTLVNEPFQVSSTLSAAGAPMPNRELSITRTNPDGSVEDLTTVTTDAHGSFHFNDSRPAGSYTYRATFQGDSFYAALSRTAVVRVLRHASNVQLGRLPAVVDAGTKIAVVATLSGTSGEISIRAQSGVGPAVTVATGSVDDGGSLRLEHIVHQNTTFTATFEASATHAMDTAQGTVLAATEVKATLRRYHRVVRRGEPDMHIYSRGVVPALIGKVLPAHPRYCVDLRLQAWDGRAWTSRDEWCAMLAADSTFRTEFPAPLRPGRYRLQGQFDDDDHAIGRLSPLYLRVER